MMNALPCLGPLTPRGVVGARHDGLPRQFSPFLPVVCHGLNLCEGSAGPLRDVVNPALFLPAPSSPAFEICRSTPRCCQSISFSACPFFACLRLLFPVVLLRLGRPILSGAHTISVFAALQLPGDLPRSCLMVVFRTCSLMTRS